MQTTYPNHETGGNALEQGMLSIDPRRIVAEDGILANFAADSGLDGPFLAGAMSMALTHERCGVVMFRALQSATANPLLQPEYERLEKESVVAVGAYEAAIEKLGGSAMYVSPAARLTESIDTKMLEALLLTGAGDPMTIDAKTVNMAGLGAMGCVMNCETLQSLTDVADDGSSKQILQKLLDSVAPASKQHHEWAMTMNAKLATTSAKHSTTAKVMNKAEGLMDKVQKKLTQPN